MNFGFKSIEDLIGSDLVKILLNTRIIIKTIIYYLFKFSHACFVGFIMRINDF
jgi:hypothetical protein